MVIPGDLRDDHHPGFSQEFYRALSVVCDDLFFARYRRHSAPAKALSQSGEGSTDAAAKSLLSAMFGNTQTEDEKGDVVEELLDVRLLPATDGQGVQFNKDRMEER